MERQCSKCKVVKTRRKISDDEWLERKAATRIRTKEKNRSANRRRYHRLKNDPDFRQLRSSQKAAHRTANLAKQREADKLYSVRHRARKKGQDVDGAIVEYFQRKAALEALKKSPPKTKPCTKCGEIKPLSEFNSRPSAILGIESECKACDFIYRKAWASRNRLKLAEQSRLRRQRPEVKAALKVSIKRWKKENPEKVRHLRKAYSARRRSNLQQVRADLTEAQWSTIKAVYRHRCAYCGQSKPLTQDHVQPVSDHGEHTASNIVPACRSCNSSKGARPPRVIYQPHLIA